MRQLSGRLAVLAAMIIFGAAGCGVSATDAQGKRLTDTVWFDKDGRAHCPLCLAGPVEPKDVDAQLFKGSVVKVGRKVCAEGHVVRWAAEDILCFNCAGSTVCPQCQGAGADKEGRACNECLAGEETDAGNVLWKGTGTCQECAALPGRRWGEPNLGSDGMRRVGSYGAPSDLRRQRAPESSAGASQESR